MDKVILKAVERSPYTGDIGCRERFEKTFNEVLLKSINRSGNSKKASRAATGKHRPSPMPRSKRDEDSDNEEEFDPANFIEEEEEDADSDDYQGIEAEMALADEAPSDVDDDSSSIDSYTERRIDAVNNFKHCRIVITAKDRKKAEIALNSQIKVKDSSKLLKPVKLYLTKIKQESVEANDYQAIPSLDDQAHTEEKPPRPGPPQRRKPGKRIRIGMPKRKRSSSSSTSNRKLPQQLPKKIKVEPSTESEAKSSPKKDDPANPKAKNTMLNRSCPASSDQAQLPTRPGPKSRKKSRVIETSAAAAAMYRERIFFCLECEGCDGKKCDHRRHPRKLILAKNKDDTSAVNRHNDRTSHASFQSLNDFIPVTPRIALEDLAYNLEYGREVRKLFKKYAKSQLDNDDLGFSSQKSCKIPGCTYQTDSIVFMFRHIRKAHVPDENLGD